ncbi:hypothetical protein ZWY2020_007866 [Hordeum vulgare]|nr:hypothetical protein ZWY2020_007866 [Hordeum vulgare]
MQRGGWVGSKEFMALDGADSMGRRGQGRCREEWRRPSWGAADRDEPLEWQEGSRNGNPRRPRSSDCSVKGDGEEVTRYKQAPLLPSFGAACRPGGRRSSTQPPPNAQPLHKRSLELLGQAGVWVSGSRRSGCGIHVSGASRRIREKRQDDNLPRERATSADSNADGSDAADLLTRYLACQDEIGKDGREFDRFLRDTTLNLMIAGRDTTSSALTWFFWLLSNNPDVETKVLAELRENLPSSGGGGGHHPSAADLKRLAYLHAALSGRSGCTRRCCSSTRRERSQTRCRAGRPCGRGGG